MKSLLLGMAAAVLCACAVSPDEPTAFARVVSADHWVQGVSAIDGAPIKLYMREKHASGLDLPAAAARRKVVLLAHGAGTPSSVAFDLQVAGNAGPTYSLMDYLAAEGYDVFALDYQNYGRSDKHSCGLCVTTDKAARDLQAAVEYVRQLRGVERVHLLCWSWGSSVVGQYAAAHPDKVGRMVMFAPPMWTGSRRGVPKEEFRSVTPANSRNLFEGPASDPAAVEAWVAAVEKWGARAPNGVLVDLNSRMPLNDPKAIRVPTMLVYGDLDRVTKIDEPNLPVFFTALPNNDKKLSIIPGAGHGMVVQKPRMRFYREVADWFRAD
jgi:pimeloyl-ACP methyl ester carboxylesterase